MPYDDTLLRIALHIYHSHDMDRIILLLKLLHNHLHRIGDLLVVEQQDLLAYYLRDKEPRRLVGKRILAEIWGRHRQKLDYPVHEIRHIEILLCRHREDLGIGEHGVPTLRELLKLRLLLHKIDLVDHHKHRDALLGHLGKEIGILRRILHHIGDIYEYVGVHKRTLAEIEHALLKLILRLKHPRSVGEHYLILGCVDDPHDAVARRLSLRRDYAHTLPHQQVHQSRLSHIGIAHDIDKSGFMFHI